MLAASVLGALHCLRDYANNRKIARSRTDSVGMIYLGLLSLLCLQPGCLLLMHLTQLFLRLRQQSRPDDHHKHKQI